MDGELEQKNIDIDLDRVMAAWAEANLNGWTESHGGQIFVDTHKRKAIFLWYVEKKKET